MRVIVSGVSFGRSRVQTCRPVAASRASMRVVIVGGGPVGGSSGTPSWEMTITRSPAAEAETPVNGSAQRC